MSAASQIAALSAGLTYMQSEEVRRLQAQLAAHMQENERLRVQLEERCDIVSFHVIGRALNTLQAARGAIRALAGTPAYTPALEQAHNAMCEAEACLGERSDDEEGDEEDDEEHDGESEEEA